MRLEPNQARTTRCCKLKRVYPRLPLHVHSAGPKGLAGTGSGNPARAEGAIGLPARASEWSPDRLRSRLENELSSDAWRQVESAARRRGTNLDDLFAGALVEAL
jgi:hypothetical protein